MKEMVFNNDAKVTQKDIDSVLKRNIFHSYFPCSSINQVEIPKTFPKIVLNFS